MNLTSLSAGTGTAALVLVGGLLLLSGSAAGWIVVFAGIGLSALWAIRLR